MQSFTASGWTFEWTGCRAKGKIHTFKCVDVTGCWLDLHQRPESPRWYPRKGGKNQKWGVAKEGYHTAGEALKAWQRVKQSLLEAKQSLQEAKQQEHKPASTSYGAQAPPAAGPSTDAASQHRSRGLKEPKQEEGLQMHDNGTHGAPLTGVNQQQQLRSTILQETGKRRYYEAAAETPADILQQRPAKRKRTTQPTLGATHPPNNRTDDSPLLGASMQPASTTAGRAAGQADASTSTATMTPGVPSWQQQYPGQQYHPTFNQPAYGYPTTSHLQTHPLAQPAADMPFFGQQQQVAPAMQPMTVVIHMPGPAAAPSFPSAYNAYCSYAPPGPYGAPPGPYGGYYQMPHGDVSGYH